MLERIVASGAGSIGLLGSTGSYAYLTPDERNSILRIAVEHVAGRCPIIVSVGALRSDIAEDLARAARKAGADGLLMAPMSYQPLTEAEVFAHFKSVSEAGELPLCIYNNPGTTGFSFGTGLIARIAELPNVAAIKMPPAPQGDFRGELERLRQVTPQGFAIGYSGDWGAKDALQAGADCWFSVVAGLLPEAAQALAKAAATGNMAQADRIDRAFAPLWQLFRDYGSYRVMFALATLLGYGPLQPPRPVLPLPAEGQAQTEKALAHLQRTLLLQEGGSGRT